MGTFAGHLLPGAFFAVFAIWWSFITALRYIQAKNNQNNNSSKYKNGVLRVKGSTTMPCICCPYGLQRLPLESIIKVVFAIIGILGEVVTGIKIHDKPTLVQMQPAPEPELHEHIHSHSKRDGHAETATLPQIQIQTWHFEGVNAQHSTMYAAFGIGAIVEILLHYNCNLPKRLDYICGILAFSVEGLLFGFHLHGRDQIDVHLHVLLEITILMCIFCCILEYINPTNIIFTYGRIVFTLLQGTWFWEIGFILYPPFDSLVNIWDSNNHQHLMFITMSYVWHFLIIFLSLLIQLLILNRFYSNSAPNLALFVDDQQHQLKGFLPLHGGSNGKKSNGGIEETKLSLDSDDEDDSEIEFDNTKLIRSSSNMSNSIRR